MDPVSISIILTTVGWIIGPLVSKFVGEAWDELMKYIRRVGLDKEAENLKDELINIQLLVEAAQSKQFTKDKEHLHRSLKHLKELVYKARDLLDELDYFRFQSEVIKMNRNEHGSSKEGKTLKLNKNDMSTKITALVKELQQKYQNIHDALMREHPGLAAQEINRKVTIERQQTTAYSHETKIYGRDSERDQILKLIKDGETNDKKNPVVAIVGQPGLGKTALAQLVYNSPGRHFDLKIWICVSVIFDVMGITRQMLEYSTHESYDKHTNLNNLKNILKKSLEGKTVLLVLDDIWDIKYQSDWNSILAPLVSNEKSNMVLVTTRFSVIGDMVRTTDPILLDGLNDSSFWSLFRKCAFDDDQYKVPYTLKKIAEEIVQKLRGNPLAGKTVGALLKGNTDGIHWMGILKNESWKYQGGDQDIMPAVKLSYDYLPVPLQQCFSYCSVFRKNYYFKKEELIYMWMAHDYIYNEDVGIEYLKTLVDRAFFQLIVTEEDWSGPRYVIHDLMHDLAQAVSSEECPAIYHNKQHIPPRPKLLHLYIHDGKVQGIENLLEFQNLKSLIIIEENKKPELFNLNWDQANNIRLLILQSQPVNSYNFTHVIHLRYLRLYIREESKHSKHDRENILAQICRLYHLEVLELDYLFCRTRFPKYFNNLVNLRHFEPDSLHCQIAGVGKLKHLQELRVFQVCEEKGFELEQLAELKELKGSLKLLNIENVKCSKEAESAKLSEKELVTLELLWSKESNPERILSEHILEGFQPNIKLRNLRIENYGGCKSPFWLANHLVEFLESIQLINCGSWEVLPNFGELRFLKELSLSSLSKVRALKPEFHGCSSGRGFPSLKLMKVDNMAELETWIWNEQFEVFILLETLTIENCPKLKDCSFVPFHGQETMCFTHFFHLRIKGCPQLQQKHLISRTGSTSEKSEIRNKAHPTLVQSTLTVQLEDLNIPSALDQVLVFKYFRNIKSLEIASCSNLTCLPWKGICLVDCLQRLTIRNCPKLLFSPGVEEDEGNSFLSHNSLQYLSISECDVTGEGLSYLLARLPDIRELLIEGCANITAVSVPGRINEPDSIMSQTTSLGSLMFLEKLEILRCPNMSLVNKGGLSMLTALRNVRIHHCDDILSSMTQKEQDNSAGFFPGYLEILSLMHVPDKMSWSPTDLIYLKYLEIRSSPSLTSVDLNNFVALRKLKLSNCNVLASVKSPNPSLESLDVSGCPSLMLSWSSPSRIDQEFLSTLKSLSIDSRDILSLPCCHALKSLQCLKLTSYRRLAQRLDRAGYSFTDEQEAALLSLTTLKELTFKGLMMQSLPREFYRHRTLRELTIDDCPTIDRLPDKGLPESLKKVHLQHPYSLELKRECSKIKNLEVS